jgi:hypothetical protein
VVEREIRHELLQCCDACWSAFTLQFREIRTIRLENLNRESEWIVLLDRRDVDIEVLGRKSSSIIRLDLDFFAGIVGPKLL